MTSLSSIAPWFGAKRTMADRIVAAIGDHSVYWEPFCGSMAVVLAKPPCRTEVVNDLHDDLVNLAKCIQHPTIGPALYRRLRRVWASESLFLDSMAVIRDDPTNDQGYKIIDQDRAFHYFVASWQGMNGLAGTSVVNGNFAKRFTSNGGDPAIRWRKAVMSLPVWRARMAGIQILKSDGIELCEKIEDKPGTVIYVDPPYLAKGAKYLYDFAPADHEQLARSLNRFRHTRVIVSYYDHPKLNILYPQWIKVEVDVTKAMVASGAQGKTSVIKAPEVLLFNFVDKTCEEPMSLFSGGVDA